MTHVLFCGHWGLFWRPCGGVGLTLILEHASWIPSPTAQIRVIGEQHCGRGRLHNDGKRVRDALSAHACVPAPQATGPVEHSSQTLKEGLLRLSGDHSRRFCTLQLHHTSMGICPPAPWISAACAGSPDLALDSLVDLHLESLVEILLQTLLAWLA